MVVSEKIIAWVIQSIKPMPRFGTWTDVPNCIDGNFKVMGVRIMTIGVITSICPANNNHTNTGIIIILILKV